MGRTQTLGRSMKRRNAASDAPVGRPRMYAARCKANLTYRQISEFLWGADYKVLVRDALDGDPEMAATLRTRMESAPGHYKRVLKKAGDSAAMQAYEEKQDLRISVMLCELDGAASQKCRTPFKEAKGIQSKMLRLGVASAGEASHEGEHPAASTSPIIYFSH
jgi:hypothetical protein